jgi:uncharacterized HAD superfamily protein
MNYFCIDIDNTIAKTDEVMRRVISDFTYGRVQLEYEDIVTFNYHECPDRQTNQITKEEWRQVHDLFSESKYLTNIEPMPGAIEGLRRLVERGTVHLATSRLRKARKATVEWLDHHGFPDHDLHFLRHGEKHAALKQFTAAVEDHYEQAVAFATIGATPCFLIRHPWNRTRDPIEGVYWVENWDELSERLLALTPPS